MKVISSLSNPFIQYLSKLNSKKNRLNSKTFIVEGFHLVEEAYKDKVLLQVLSTDEELLNKFDKLETYKVTNEIIKKLSTTINPQNIIGVVKINIYNDYESIIKDKSKVVLLDDINDPGNLGTIIRTCCALGYDAIISSPNSVDYYNEKTIRASQGAIFKIPLLTFDLVDVITFLKNNSYEVYCSNLHATKNIEDIDKFNKLAVVFGNEAHGVSEKVAEQSTINFKIEMAKSVESLNVSVACAIILWELKK